MAEQVKLTASEKGRHAELLAQTALLARGWSVLEPIAPEPYDLAIRRHADNRTYYVQVKTVLYRDEAKYNGEWLVVKGAKSNRKVYTRNEVDYFVAVWRGGVYMFPNEGKSEYWVRPWEIDDKWLRIDEGKETIA